jgi:hypothetical protein
MLPHCLVSHNLTPIDLQNGARHTFTRRFVKDGRHALLGGQQTSTMRHGVFFALERCGG